MKDPRITVLAKNLLNYSINLHKGENLLIELNDSGEDLVSELIKEAYRIGAKPFVSVKRRALLRDLLMEAEAEHFERIAAFEAARMKDMDAFISVRGITNTSCYSDVPGEKMSVYNRHFVKPVHFDIRVPHTKWMIMNYPNDSMAQAANMSSEQFEDFYFNVCNLDYSKMSKAMDALVKVMNQTDNVHIKGGGTDLRFSIKGLSATKCDGKVNLPDGEVFTAPVKDSVNGYITYNTPSEYGGSLFNHIRLEFEKGKIIKAEADDTERINHILNVDEGARYIGEFALGVNPYIIRPMKDTLFDEKIMGSFHFTPGDCCKECFNGNRSSVHWDLVCIQTPEYGGGEIRFDDVLIRKDGRFVLKELDGLNPENLK